MLVLKLQDSGDVADGADRVEKKNSHMEPRGVVPLNHYVGQR